MLIDTFLSISWDFDELSESFFSVGRLMVEVFDMLQAMILDADFRDERQAIMQQIRKLADS